MSGFSSTMSLLGVTELTKKLSMVEAQTDKAVQIAVKKVQRKVVASVRSRLNGAPRWGHRGRSKVYSEPIDLGFDNRPRGGPPGKFTGDLRRGVGGRKKPVSVAGGVHGGVGVGGPRLRQNNFKKNKLERKYPYFRPGFDAVKGSLTGDFEEALSTALKKVGL